MSKVITESEVAANASEKSAWIIVDGKVYDMTDFLDDHPGGKKILLKNCGKDSSAAFWKFHGKKVIDKTAKPYLIGTVGEKAKL